MVSMYLCVNNDIHIFAEEAYERLPCPGPARPLKINL